VQSSEIRDIDLERLFPPGARFDVRGLLGRGANGIVYRVHDRETRRELALKTLVSPDVEQIYHLKAEFRSLAKIVHPNLVHLEELVVTSDACFFTMELIDGATLSTWASALPAAEKIERLASVALQLASGIAALHDAGKLHRDIKPTNILVAKDDRAVLVDFGLCTELRLVERRRSDLVGTLMYMAPEQAWGKPLSRAADWYALGAVLYEAVAGRLPFEEEGSRLVFAKEKVPPVPDELAPEAVPLLDLARALLDPFPDRRPQPAAIFAALGGGAPSSRRPDASSVALGYPANPPSSGVRVPSAFVGRSSEWAAMFEALGDIVDGRPAVVHVEGASGIGKTELVERFVTNLESRPGSVILRGRCHPRESVSYNGFDGIVDELSEWLSRLPDSELADVLPADADALQAIFPMFGRIAAIATEPDGSRTDAYELRRRSFRALRELFVKMAERHTVVVVLDDVQWGGADTAALVGDVFRPPYSPRVLLVLSYRSEDEERSAMLSELRKRAGILFDSIHRIVLGPLDPEASCELALHLLAAGEGSARHLAEHIVAEAGGHPLFIRELALAIAASEVSAAASGSPLGPEARLRGGGPADLGALLAQRITQLPRTERSILELASVASRPLPRRVVLSAVGEGAQALGEVLRLARKRLLRETAVAGEPAVEPFHSRVREAVLGSASPAERQRCHRALADILLAEAEPDADALVEQLLGAGDGAGAARFALVAAKRAHDALAFDRAVHLYRVALDAPSSALQEPRWQIRARLAGALVDAGRSRDAADAFARAAGEAALEDPAAAADLERRAAEQFMRGGHIDDGLALLKRVLVASSVPYPSTHAGALATVLAFRTRVSLRGFGFRPRPAEQCPPEELARVDACWSAGLGHAWLDTTRAAAFQARYMHLALRAREPSRVSLGLSTEASQMAAAGGTRRTERAREIMERALSAAKQAEGHAAHAFTLLMAGSIEFYGSRWREALTLCERAERLLREHKSRSEWELMTAHTLSLASLAHLGELRMLRRRQIQLLDEARERGNLLAAVCLACGPANVGWLAADDPAEALRRADDALAPWKNGAFQLAQYLHLVATTQIALYRGDAHGALRRITSAWPRVISSMMLYIQNFRVTLRHLRARAALAVVAVEGPGAVRRGRLLRLARAEAQKLSRDDVPFARPLGLAIEAGACALSNEREKSAALLDEAASGFRELEMMLHAAAADHERGRLVGGDSGRLLRTEAEARMIDEDVASPERLAVMFVPGIT